MTEPVSAAWIAVTAGGITVLGVVTGLQPDLMLAGAAGGWWAQIYVQPANAWARINRLLLAAVIAAWAAPPAVAFAGKWLPTMIPTIAWQWLAALGVGLVAIDALGRGLLTLTRAVLRKRTPEADK